MSAIQARAVRTLLDALDFESSGRVSLDVLEQVFVKLGSSEDDLKVLRASSLREIGVEGVVSRLWMNGNSDCDLPEQNESFGMMPTLSRLDRAMPSSPFVTSNPSITFFSDDPTLGHPLRGVSIYHLETELIREAEAHGFSRGSTVYDIEEALIHAKGADMRCPRDGQLGAAYVDAISGADHAGLATMMLSYTWGYKIGDLVDALSEHAKLQRLPPKRTYVWICCFCINQHKVRAASSVGHTIPFEEFQKEFGIRVRKINSLVALMSPWNDPSYLKRVWCDFELYTAITEEVAVSIIMPPEETARFHEAICKESGIDGMWKHFGNVRVQEADASVRQDRDRILNMIRAGPGFGKLNSVVVKHLQTWMVQSSEAYLQECFHDNGAMAPKPSTLKLCRNVNNLLRNMGRFARAASIVEQALGVCHRTGMGETASVAELLRQLGILKRKQHDLEAAETSFMEAWRIHEVTNTLETADGALLMLELGITSLERDDLISAQTALAAGKAIAKKIGVLDKNLGGLLFRHCSTLQLKLGNMDEAERELEEAQRVYERTGNMGSPAGANLQMCMGQIRRQRGDLTGAMECFVKAHRIRETTGTADTPEAKELVRWIRAIETETGQRQCTLTK